MHSEIGWDGLRCRIRETWNDQHRKTHHQRRENMRAPIDINKKYQTRNGRKVHLYEGRNEYFYGRYCGGGLGGALDCWTPASWNLHGICDQNFVTDFDLIPVKHWRAWKEGEGPKFFMVRSKDGGLMLGLDRSKIDCLKNCVAGST